MDTSYRREIDNLGSELSKIISCYDRPIEERLTKAGITIKYFINKKFDAFLRWDEENDCPLIALNANQSQNRMNFSMAHELGHLVINYGWIPFQINSDVNSKMIDIKYRGGEYTKKERHEETIVNEFAAAFLVPNDKLTEFIERNHELNYQEMIIKISDDFNISVDAAKIRLDNFLSLSES